MTERNGGDEDTRRIEPESGDATRPIDPISDETRPVDRLDEPTRRMDAPPAPEPTATQRVAPLPAAAAPATETLVIPRREARGVSWLVALAIVLALAVGAAVGYAQRGGSDEGVVARELVGPKGGVIEFGKVGKVEVPAQALPTATAITVRKVTNENRVRLGPEGDPRSVLYEPGELQMYAFEPPDLHFQHPVKITIPRPNDGEALLVDTPEGARVVAAKGDGDKAVIETDSFAFEP